MCRGCSRGDGPGLLGSPGPPAWADTYALAFQSTHQGFCGRNRTEAFVFHEGLFFEALTRFAHRTGHPARAPWLASTARLLLTRFYPGSFLMLGRVNHLAVKLATLFRVIKPGGLLLPKYFSTPLAFSRKGKLGMLLGRTWFTPAVGGSYARALTVATRHIHSPAAPRPVVSQAPPRPRRSSDCISGRAGGAATGQTCADTCPT